MSLGSLNQICEQRYGASVFTVGPLYISLASTLPSFFSKISGKLMKEKNLPFRGGSAEKWLNNIKIKSWSYLEILSVMSYGF